MLAGAISALSENLARLLGENWSESQLMSSIELSLEFFKTRIRLSLPQSILVCKLLYSWLLPMVTGGQAEYNGNA